MKKVIKSFAAGLTIGLLFAPQSGAKTRKKLSKVFKDYKEDVQDHLAGAVGAVEEKVHKTKEAIEGL